MPMKGMTAFSWKLAYKVSVSDRCLNPELNGKGAHRNRILRHSIGILNSHSTLKFSHLKREKKQSKTYTPEKDLRHYASCRCLKNGSLLTSQSVFNGVNKPKSIQVKQ